MDIKELMNKLLSDLDKEGFILQYYEAYSTSSCYIKLDYGVSNSIRIADHKGIDKYQYKFNLMVNLDKSYEDNGRLYYDIDDYNKMISDIKKFKDEQLKKYGFHYYECMLKHKKDDKDKRGFWEKAKNYNDNF